MYKECNRLIGSKNSLFSFNGVYFNFHSFAGGMQESKNRRLTMGRGLPDEFILAVEHIGSISINVSIECDNIIDFNACTGELKSAFNKKNGVLKRFKSKSNSSCQEFNVSEAYLQEGRTILAGHLEEFITGFYVSFQVEWDNVEKISKDMCEFFHESEDRLYSPLHERVFNH